jgi:16S rRNA (guanine527-N7)-methyltransferase
VTDVVARLQGQAAEALGHQLSQAQTDLFVKYLNILQKWQRSQRLIGSSDPAWIVDHVIVDSLLFLRALPAGVRRLCDVGSGAGIPGIPLKIVMPDTDVTLIEARARRASFLSAAIRELPLPGCRVINRRLENIVGDLEGKFDAVVMRCAGGPQSLLGPIERLLAPSGVIVASGPPEPYPLAAGEWVEVVGPLGLRRFWVYRIT